MLLRVLPLAVLLALPLFAPAQKAEINPEPPKKFVPPKTLGDLVRIAEEGGDVKRGAAVLSKNYSGIDELMISYRPRRWGGVGVGPMARDDGINQRLLVLQRRELTAGELKDQQADLLHIAYHAVAISEVAKRFASANGKGNRGLREWALTADEVQAGAKDLVTAAAAKDPRAVRRAAVRLNEGCIDCHIVFRE